MTLVLRHRLDIGELMDVKIFDAPSLAESSFTARPCSMA